VVLKIGWTGNAPANLAWDGTDSSGRPVPDGRYTYTLSGVDSAENEGVFITETVTIDTRPTPLGMTVEHILFSPNGDGRKDANRFSPRLGLSEGVESWTLEIRDQADTMRRRITGSGSPPGSIVFDGKDGRGAVLPDGMYRGVLDVVYVKGNRPQASSSFRLDITPPRINIGLSPQPFSPDQDGVEDTVTISLDISDSNPLEDWSAEIQDPRGRPFKDFTGTGSPPRTIIWDGLSAGGELVQSAESYPLVVEATDEAGNTATIKREIETDILVMRDGDRLKIIITGIHFKPYTADYTNVPADRAERNLSTLSRLSEILKRYPAYRIQLEGHAVSEYWNIPQRAEKEEREELQPLSKARAEAIKQALVYRGIEADRMTTRGYGGTRPVVPHGDRANHWKNRRVEFILLKPTG
jgi:hypothetical protein